MFMYVGAQAILHILKPGRVNKKLGLLTALIAWLSLEKVLAFPRLLATLLPNGIIGTNTALSTVIVIAAQLSVTYLLVLIISRLLLTGEGDSK